MEHLFLKLLGHAGDLAENEPLVALFLGAALLAVFLTALLGSKTEQPESAGFAPLIWTLYRNSTRLIWAVLLVLFLLSTMNVVRTYLSEVTEEFQHDHGRITAANYAAVQTIWGSEQRQSELKVDVYNDVEVTDRIESEDLTKPAILRKKTVRTFAVGNPYVSESHVVTLNQSPRKKGSAFYDGYLTDCVFTWKLRNPADTAESCQLTFPLPAEAAVFDSLAATLNGQDVLPKMEIKDGSLVLKLNLAPSETMDLNIGFKSRGLSYWYFQILEAREIRDFNLTLNLPDLPPTKLNYPGECMTPTAITPTQDGQGAILNYRLDHALSNKGMGIALPQLPQPGETTRAVLGEVERAWLLTFAMLALGLTLAGVRQAVLLTLLFSVATALGYGLLADFSDLALGFWGTLIVVLVPLFGVLAWLLRRIGRGAGLMLAVELVLIGLLYPCAAGLDIERHNLYLDLYGVLLLASNTWLVVNRYLVAEPEGSPGAVPKPA